MDNCQHDPARIITETKASPATVRIVCRRCGVACPPRVWAPSTDQSTLMWNEWAALMVVESDAKRAREGVDPASPDPSSNATYAAATRWLAFCRGYGCPPNAFGSIAVEDMGRNFKDAQRIHAVLTRHLKGPVTEQRLSDLLVLFRKATRAFHMWGVLDTPKDEK